MLEAENAVAMRPIVTIENGNCLKIHHVPFISQNQLDQKPIERILNKEKELFKLGKYSLSDLPTLQDALFTARDIEDEIPHHDINEIIKFYLIRDVFLEKNIDASIRLCVTYLFYHDNADTLTIEFFVSFTDDGEPAYQWTLPIKNIIPPGQEHSAVRNWVKRHSTSRRGRMYDISILMKTEETWVAMHDFAERCRASIQAHLDKVYDRAKFSGTTPNYY